MGTKFTIEATVVPDGLEVLSRDGQKITVELKLSVLLRPHGTQSGNFDWIKMSDELLFGIGVQSADGQTVIAPTRSARNRHNKDDNHLARRRREIFASMFSDDQKPMSTNFSGLLAANPDGAAGGKSEDGHLVVAGDQVRDVRDVRIYPYIRVGREVRGEVVKEARRNLFLGAIGGDREERRKVRDWVRRQTRSEEVGTRMRELEHLFDRPDDPYARIRRWRQIGGQFLPNVRRDRLASTALSEVTSRPAMTDKAEDRQSSNAELAESIFGPERGPIASAFAWITGSGEQKARFSPLNFTPDAELATAQHTSMDRFEALLAGSGRPGTAATEDGEASQELFDQAWKPDFAETVGGPPDRKPRAESVPELIRRRLAEVGAHPTLMRFLGLLVDVRAQFEFGPAQLAALGNTSGRSYGLITVAFADSAAPATAFTLDLSFDNPMFEPCPQSEWPDQPFADVLAHAFPYRDGFIDLKTEVLVDGQPLPMRRFDLDIIDAAAAINAIRSQAQATLDAHDAGTPVKAVPTSMPELRGGGIRLLDHGADVTHTMEQVKVFRGANLAGNGKPRFAEDLISGFRLDVVHSGNAPRAYSASARELVYPDINEAFGKSRNERWHPYPEHVQRDDGYLLPTVKERELPADKRRPKAPAKEGPVQFPSEVLITWSGRNAGLPSAPSELPDPDEGDCPPPIPLPLEVHYALPDKRRRLGPALRTGKPYRLMLRSRKVNGGSVAVATSRHLIDRYALGSSKNSEGAAAEDAPLVYRRMEKVAQPIVLVAAGDPLLTRPIERSPMESDTSLVLHDGREKRLRRIVLAPRGDFELVEQAGLLELNSRLVNGVYQRVAMDHHSGALPAAKRPGGDPKSRQVGHLFANSAPDPSRERPHHLDPAGRLLGARLLREDGAELGWIRPGAIPAFWTGVPGDETVTPILVEVVPAKPGVRSGLNVDRSALAGYDEVPVIRVVAAPADALRLEMWAVLEPEEVNNRQMLFEATDQIRSFASKENLSDFSDDLLRQAAARRPNDSFCYSVPLSITHAVQRPLLPPRFVFSAGRALRLVRWRDQTTWGEHVHQCFETYQPPSECNLLQADAVDSYVIGALRIDSASTGRVRCEARWMSYAFEDAHVKPGKGVRTADLFSPIGAPSGGGGAEFIPKALPGTVFDIPLPRRDGDPNAAFVDLLRDEAGGLRSLLSGLDKDPRAKRIALRLVGTSRFHQYYPAREDEKGQFESASATEEEMEHSLDYVRGKPTLGAPTIWLDATARPAPPTVTAVRIMLPTSVSVTGGGGKEVLRRVTTRIYLGSKWFSSGEGELLAVICAGEKLLDDERPARQPGLGGRYPAADRHLTPEESWRREELRKKDPVGDRVVSQWGADPTTLSQPLPTNRLPPDALAGYAWKLANQALYTRTRDGEADERHQVSAICFEPRFDRSNGEWFVDVDIDTAATKAPFLRLSLARYQAHALFDDKMDLRFSEPFIMRDMKLWSPCRAKAERQEDVLVVEITAPTYTERAPAAFALSNPARATDLVRRAQAPTYSIEVAGQDPRGGSRLLFDDQNRPLELVISEFELDESGTGAVWRASFQLPLSVRREKLLVTIEEQEQHLDSRSVLDKDFAQTGPLEPVIVRTPLPIAIELEAGL